MKITILGTAYPYRGGMAALNERIAKQFTTEGNEVKIETFTLQYPSFLFPGKTQYSTEAAPANLNITRSVNAINPFNWISVGNKIKKDCPDVLLFRYWIPAMAPCFGTIARIVAKNKHTKIISILDNVIPHEKKWADKMLTKYFLGGIHSFVAMSKSVLKDLELFNTKKPRAFSPHPLYDNFGPKVEKAKALQILHLDDQYHYLLFFGFIRDYKGLDILLDAFADERIKAMKVKLLVAGEFYGKSEKYFEQEKRLQLKNVIWSNDFIPDSQVGDYFGACDMVVQPYKTATQSGVTQIAYHFERPMLVTNVGGLAEIVPDQKVGYVVEPNAKEVADALVDFYTNNRETEFTENTKTEKLKYGWDKMTQTIYNLAK